jgi:hypothetical protein
MKKTHLTLSLIISHLSTLFEREKIGIFTIIYLLDSFLTSGKRQFFLRASPNHAPSNSAPRRGSSSRDLAPPTRGGALGYDLQVVITHTKKQQNIFKKHKKNISHPLGSNPEPSVSTVTTLTNRANTQRVLFFK